MAIAFGRFDTMSWDGGAHPLERKKLVPGHGVALIEFSPGFADPIWCDRSHVLYVVEGRLELELDDGVTTVGPGQCVVIGRATRHRARNPGTQRVVLFLASDFEPRAPIERVPGA